MRAHFNFYRLTLLFGCLGIASGAVSNAQSVTFGTELGTGRIICTDDDDNSQESDDPSYALAAAWDARVFGEGSIPCFSRLTDLDAGIWKQSEPFTGSDLEGRKADFRIYVLHDTYSWKLGSTWAIQKDGVEADPSTIFQAPNFMQRFCASNTAFAFGASSHEGPKSANERAAAKRAATVANALRMTRETCHAGRIPIIFGINLGEHRYDPSCPSAECSANQRKVIIISADEISTGVDMAAALAAGIKKQRVFEDLAIENYSLFAVRSY